MKRVLDWFVVLLAAAVIAGFRIRATPALPRWARRLTTATDSEPSNPRAWDGVAHLQELGRVHVSERVVYEGEGDEC